jgi:hypothetical protein
LVDIPLTDAVAQLAATAKVKIALDERALADAGLAKATPVSLRVKNVTPQAALSLMCLPLSLTWVREKDGLLLTTPEVAETRLLPVTYDIRGLDADPTAAELIEAIESTVTPDRWEDVGGAGSLQVTQPGVLTARQSDDVHRELEALFAALRGK